MDQDQQPMRAPPSDAYAAGSGARPSGPTAERNTVLFTGHTHVRMARPSRDLVAAERFWVAGLGLTVLFRAEGGGEPGAHDLLMVGHPDASWHLELVHGGDHPVDPRPTDEDLLVLYLDGPVPQELVDRLLVHGGTRVASPNPYWNEWGVTVEDPDGYRLVLCRRGWSNS